MDIEYRHARPNDLPHAAAVFAAAIDDLNKKHGYYEGPTSTNPPNPQYAFWLQKNPAAFWVAEEEGRIVGYTYSFLRGSLWFLADLFILPTHQGRGIGGSLIERTLGSWRKNHKIDIRSLITPAFNRASVSLYMRFGMLPRQPAYFASAPKNQVLRTLKSSKSRAIEVEEFEDIDSISSKLGRIHERALGFPPGWHNEFFSKVLHARCLLFKKDHRLEGYAFLRKDGRIGPLLVKSASSFRPALEKTLSIAAEGDGEDLTIFFPGTNAAAVSASIEHGFRISYPLLFLSSKPMGDWGNYLFYSPGLM